MKRNRTTLKGYFIKGAIPTEANFADLIDSMLTQGDDNIGKLPNDPLRITASGSEENLLNFYRVQGSAETLSWQLKQKPEGKPGLSIGDATTSRLFIESGTGNVGIGTNTPGAKLEVAGDFIRKIAMKTGLGPEDTTDNGQIVSRVLAFTKRYAATAIRIFYCDTLRVLGNDVAARWEIRIDGKTVPGGALIADKYSGSANQSWINHHDPTTILGYATGVTAGDHEIQIWVGPVPAGTSLADAHTGWSSSRWTIEAQEVWI